MAGRRLMTSAVRFGTGTGRWAMTLVMMPPARPRFVDAGRYCATRGLHMGTFLRADAPSLAQNCKTLREATGLPFKVCRQALEATGNDVDAARKYIEEHASARAEKAQEKLADRTANEGLVSVSVGKHAAILVTLGCETDFVARNDVMKTLSAEIGNAVLTCGSDTYQSNPNIEDVLAMPCSEETVSLGIAQAMASVGEKIVLRDVSVLRLNCGVLGKYVHKGTYAAVVGIECPKEASTDSSLQILADQLAQHIVAIGPDSSDEDGLSTLYDANFLFDDSQTIRDVVSNASERVSGKPDALSVSFLRRGLKAM